MSDNLHFLLTRKEMLEGILNKIRNDGQDNGTTFFLIPTWWIDSIDDFVGNGFIGQKPNMHLDFRIKLKIEEYLTIDIVHWNYLRETFGVTYVGNPIDCVHTKDIPEDVLNTYCWIHSTYTIPSAFWKRIGIDVAHPGIDKTVDPDERRYVKYYQWVCFCLFFQVRKNIKVDIF